MNHAWHSDDGRKARIRNAICQGVSPDPELFLNRVEVLGACSMIEHLFIATDRDGQVNYTPIGRRHVPAASGVEHDRSRVEAIV